MIDRSDPVLALLADEDDLPPTYLRLSSGEQAWRGRLFFMSWALSGHEAYAWTLALANAPAYVREVRRALATIDDQRIIDDVRLLREERGAAT